MAYIKNIWVDQEVERPRTYEMTNNADGSVTLIDSFGLVSELGTPVNADNMNHIEEGIADCDMRKYNLAETYEKGEWVTGVADGEKGIYESLTDNNYKNPLTDTTNWKKKEFGGSSGFEVCDIGMTLYINESKGLRRYLNGQIVAINSNTQGFLNRLLKIKALSPSLFTTEENWQAEKTLSAFKQVGKFVLNYASDNVTVESVRLPAVVNIQGLFDLKNLGMTVNAGLLKLPKITGDEIYHNVSPGSTRILTGLTNINYASDETPNTIQEEAIQYPFFIQIATGVEEKVDITKEISLNNPFFFGLSAYFEKEPNNISWLLSKGQWNTKALYPDYYNWILENLNKGAERFKSSTSKRA